MKLDKACKRNTVFRDLKQWIAAPRRRCYGGLRRWEILIAMLAALRRIPARRASAIVSEPAERQILAHLSRTRTIPSPNGSSRFCNAVRSPLDDMSSLNLVRRGPFDK